MPGNLTVRDLIVALQKLPPDTPLAYFNRDRESTNYPANWNLDYRVRTSAAAKRIDKHTFVPSEQRLHLPLDIGLPDDEGNAIPDFAPEPSGVSPELQESLLRDFVFDCAAIDAKIKEDHEIALMDIVEPLDMKCLYDDDKNMYLMLRGQWTDKRVKLPIDHFPNEGEEITVGRNQYVYVGNNLFERKDRASWR